MYISDVVMTNITFEALAEPSRRQLLDAVRDTELSVGDLVDIVGLSQPGVSRHLRILREAGLVTVRTNAQRRLYRARPDALLELDQWLAPYRRYWSIRLDALGKHLEDTSKRTKTGDER
jgi:DNA-binding transcriptional ArsR family regulator